MLAVVVGAGLSGGIVSYWGRYLPFLVGGPMILAVGAGLLFTVRADTSSGALIGYQILLGLGTGFCLQNTLIAVQADCADERDIPQKTGLVTFARETSPLCIIVLLTLNTTFYFRRARRRSHRNLDRVHHLQQQARFRPHSLCTRRPRDRAPVGRRYQDPAVGPAAW